MNKYALPLKIVIIMFCLVLEQIVNQTMMIPMFYSHLFVVLSRPSDEEKSKVVHDIPYIE